MFVCGCGLVPGFCGCGLVPGFCGCGFVICMWVWSFPFCLWLGPCFLMNAELQTKVWPFSTRFTDWPIQNACWVYIVDGSNLKLFFWPSEWGHGDKFQGNHVLLHMTSPSIASGKDHHAWLSNKLRLGL